MVKNLLTKIKVTSIFLLLFILTSLSFYAGKIFAEDGNPIPKARLPCDVELDPEFQSLRPYQAAPCEEASWTLFCGNKINIVETKTERRRGCFTELPTNWTVDKDYYIDLSETELPILGNTELVQNSQSSAETLDDAAKLNEYVSWYLQGTNTRAEYGDTKSTDYETVNFSGPLQKLLPQAIAEAQRIVTIASASAAVTVPVDDDEPAVSGTGPASHNQIVVCTQGGKPTPCYKGDGSGAQGRVYRLKDWSDGTLSPVTTFFNWIGTNVWNNRYPPLPWQFSDQILYQKAYNEWRGKTCALVPIINKLVCSDLPLVSNRNDFADLYTYIPLANTSDFLGKMPIFTTTIQPSSGTQMDSSWWSKLSAPTLFYSHTKESLDLVNTLNKTFIPSGLSGGTIPPDTVEPKSCTFQESRSNPGDDLFPIKKPGDVGVHVFFHVSELGNCECKTVCGDKNNREVCHDETTCHGQVSIGIHTDPNRVPFAEEIFNSTVADNASTFRRIYPKVENKAPVNCIANIPAVTRAVYVPVEGTDKITVEGPLGSKNQEVMDPENARIYFPHFGSVYDYFLKGIQTALRPKGFGDPTPVSGQSCNNVNCGELPTLPSITGSCLLGGSSSKVGTIPPSLKRIISAAAQTYNVPPNLILGIMYGEGLFNPGRFNWTDENVKNWATCQKVPNCNEGSGDDNFMGFIGNDWENIAPNIAEDLLALDPTRQTLSQCNLLDAVYGLAWNLHDSADGGGGLPSSCFGISLNSSVPGSCSWNDSQYESAIKVHESGYTNYCLTKEGSCATGGGLDAACPSGDSCETKDNRYGNPSHNACVWDVAHGN